MDNPFYGPGATIVHPDGQTDLWTVDAAQAWAITKGSPSVLVAVLDTGVDPTQRQLIGKVTVGQDVCQHSYATCASPFDNNGHGTFVTGLIAANTDDGIGIASLGWNTQVLDLKVLNDEGQGNTPDEATGIYDAVSRGAKVINISYTSLPCSAFPDECGPDRDAEAAVQYAIARGVVVVAAAGNSQEGKSPSTEPLYPASYPGVLAVAASTDQGVVNPPNGGPYLDFSEYGDAANIAAPGIDVLSTWYDGNYAVQSGTSEAAPLVSAAAALVLAADPDLTGPQVATLLRQTASPAGSDSDPIDGGILNAGAAVAAAAAHQVPSTLDGYQLIGSDGSVYSAGVAAFEGSMVGRHVVAPIVGGAERPDGLGYWLVSSNGSVYAFGFPSAHFYGSAAGAHPRQPVVAIASTPDGRGYWLVGRGGSVISFGDARSFGTAVKYDPSAIVGMVATPDGRGYWLVSATGDVYNFGDAGRYGSASAMRLSAPIVGMAATSDGRGYWLVGKDGGVFAFGDAEFYGGAAGQKPVAPIVGIAASPSGHGYWLADAAGHVYDFPSTPAAPYEVPSKAGARSAPIVAITS